MVPALDARRGRGVTRGIFGVSAVPLRENTANHGRPILHCVVLLSI